MITAVIVQARLGSTRLPAKVLLPLPNGRTVLEEVLYRCGQIGGIDMVVLAIPDTPENDILERVARSRIVVAPMLLVRGPEHDVLARYVKAAEAVNADVIIRVTSDCPLIDSEVCGRVLSSWLAQSRICIGVNTDPRTWPHGFDCEVFAADALKAANRDATEPDDREHVTPFLRRNLPIMNVTSEGEDRSHLRWTLDTLDDYVVIWNAMQEQMREAA